MLVGQFLAIFERGISQLPEWLKTLWQVFASDKREQICYNRFTPNSFSDHLDSANLGGVKTVAEIWQNCGRELSVKY
jgi:hypothetical protein